MLTLLADTVVQWSRWDDVDGGRRRR